MFKKYSLKKQFVLTFILIIVSSILSVLILTSLYFFLMNIKVINPANHYENMVPKIRSFVDKNSDKVLDENYKDKLDDVIPSEGFLYKVIDFKNNSEYGTLKENITIDKGEILRRLNTTDIDSKNVVNYYLPVIDKNASITGVVMLRYILKVTPNQIPKSIFKVLTNIIIICPFLFIILYTIIFGSKLSKNINKPLKELIEASKKIKENDLDFTLNYSYDNELGSVIDSFEEMRKQLKITLKNQWNVEEEKRDMISSLSHDLRSPLTLIKGNAQLLEDGAYKNEERLLKYLNIINKSTDRAILLVEDLNTLNKLENPHFKLNLKKVNLKDFLKSKIDEYRILGDQNNIEINLKTENISKDFSYNFDKFNISRVLDNIFMNSLRYTKEGGNITLKVLIKENKLNFIIYDEGKGFTKEDLNLALNKFYRGDKSRQKNSGNSGLGLYICKIIIEKHKGKIHIYNNENGAVVEFFI